MQLNAYSVYDNKSLTYSPPFFVNTDGAAVRMFQELANDTQTSVGRHPSDYSLYQVGTFEDGHAALTPVLPIRHVIDASALLAIKQKMPLFDALQKRSIDEDFEARKEGAQ